MIYDFPNSKPDKYLQLTAYHKAEIWQMNDHFLVKAYTKDGETIVYVERGILDNTVKEDEIRFAIFKAVFDKFMK